MSGEAHQNYDAILTWAQFERLERELRDRLDRAAELSQVRLEGEAVRLVTRIDAMDKAATILSENVNRVPTLLDREIKTLHDLTEEKFESVVNRIAGTQTLAATVQADAATAIAAAFAAADKAVRAQNDFVAALMKRSEDTVQSRLTGIETQINGLRAEWLAGHTDLKERTVRLEASSSGAVQQRTELHNTVGNIGSLFGVVGVAAAIIFGWIAMSNKGAGGGEVHEVVYAAPPPGLAATSPTTTTTTRP